MFSILKRRKKAHENLTSKAETYHKAREKAPAEEPAESSQKKQRNIEKQNRKNLVFRLRKTIAHYFPDLFDRLRQIEDYRQAPEYELVELMMACVAMFLFKEGSRNAMNNDREEGKFKKNYRRVFNLRLPHMDTVDRVLRRLAEEELEKLKKEMIQVLIEKKVFAKHRLLGKYYRVVIDGTHVMTVNEGHCDHCLTQTSKKGKVTCFHNVVEAKFVSDEGFCLSLGTEWIENPEGDFDKQDCEQKAFGRLAQRLKRDYPRLPLCVVADALYPNQTFFEICQQNNWAWIVTFKDGNLPSVWNQVLKPETPPQTQEHTSQRQGHTIGHTYTWVNDIEYRGQEVHWFECVQEIDGQQTRFVYLSNLPVDRHHVLELTASGRMRWKIENEGFNTQKNQGYGLGHQYSRVSLRATKNYYQCMQIAHLINQLFELGSLLQPLLTAKTTIKHLWKSLISEMQKETLSVQALEAFLARGIQIRFA